MQETLLMLAHVRRNKNSSTCDKDNSKSKILTSCDNKHLLKSHSNFEKLANNIKQDDIYENVLSKQITKSEVKNSYTKIKDMQQNSPKNGLEKPFVNYCAKSPRNWMEEKDKIRREIGDFQEQTSEVISPQNPLNDLPNFSAPGKSNFVELDFPGDSREVKSLPVNNSVVDENYNMREYLNKMKQIYLQKEKVTNKLVLEKTESEENLSFSRHPRNALTRIPNRKYPLLLNDECRCVNPGISHACASRQTNEDFFGILNPMFADTDPANSPILQQKVYTKRRSKARGLYKAKSSSMSDSNKKSSFLSLAEFRQGSLELNDYKKSIIPATRSKTYSDFLSALSPVDSDLNYSYFYPNDLREEIMFPLPDSLQKGVFRNPNAREASFSIGKPQKLKRVEPLKILIPEVDEESLLTEIAAFNDKSEDFQFEDRLKYSFSSSASAKSGLESRSSSFESQDVDDGDNFGRQEYLEYKASTESSRRNSGNSVMSEVAGNLSKMEETESSGSPTGEDGSTRGCSSFVGPEAVTTIPSLEFNKAPRKLSLPCQPITQQCDISSIYVDDLQNSLNQIYQPLPAVIFGNNGNRASNKSSINEDEINLLNMEQSQEFQAGERKEIKSPEPDSSQLLSNLNQNQSYSSVKTDKNFLITDIQNHDLSLESSISRTILPAKFGNSIYSATDEKLILDEVSDDKDSTNSVSPSFAENEIQKINSSTERENIQTGARRKRREGVSAPSNMFPALDLDYIPDLSSSLPFCEYSKLSSSTSSGSSPKKSPTALSFNSLASSSSSLSSTSSSSSSSSSSCSESSTESSSSSDSDDMLL